MSFDQRLRNATTIDHEDMSREDVSREDVSREDVSREDVPREDVPRKLTTIFCSTAHEIAGIDRPDEFDRILKLPNRSRKPATLESAEA